MAHLPDPKTQLAPYWPTLHLLVAVWGSWGGHYTGISLLTTSQNQVFAEWAPGDTWAGSISPFWQLERWTDWCLQTWGESHRCYTSYLRKDGCPSSCWMSLFWRASGWSAGRCAWPISLSGNSRTQCYHAPEATLDVCQTEDWWLQSLSATMASKHMPSSLSLGLSHSELPSRGTWCWGKWAHGLAVYSAIQEG